ncbi:MAG: hypothetical protein F6K16_31530 [Symploca sp. SIO2B6]|nr:hypothetical protein [Symploca sp. SIO2B6]
MILEITRKPRKGLARLVTQISYQLSSQISHQLTTAIAHLMGNILDQTHPVAQLKTMPSSRPNTFCFEA